MKRPGNCARATVIALLAAIGPALGALGCSATPEPLGEFTPGACGCEELPAIDPRVPWAELWRDIRYSPDGQAVALVGPTPFIVSWARDQNAGSADPRDGTPESDALVRAGVHVLAWRPDGTTSHFIAPYKNHREEEAGSWSADSRYYAKVMTKDQDIELVLFDLADGSWTRAATIERWTTSPPSWNPLAPEVAVVEGWTTWSARYRKAIGARSALEDGSFEARLAHRMDQSLGPPVVEEPSIPLAGVLVASPRDGMIRERTLDEFPDDVRAIQLSWSPDGRFLLLSTWTDHGGWDCEVRLLDAATLSVLDTLTGARGSSNAPPSWSPDGRRFAMGARWAARVTIVEVSANGRFEASRVLEVPAPIVQMTWCPSGERLLLFCSRQAPDVIEFFSTIANFGENVPHRRTYTVWFLDPLTGEATECEDLRITNRDVDWYDAWMIPRVAEAFAQWAR